MLTLSSRGSRLNRGVLAAVAIGVLTLSACSDDEPDSEPDNAAEPGSPGQNENSDAPTAGGDDTGAPTGDPTDAPDEVIGGAEAPAPPESQHPQVPAALVAWVAANESSSGADAQCPLIELEEFSGAVQETTSAAPDYAEWDVTLQDLGTPEGNVTGVVCTALGGPSEAQSGISLAAVAPGMNIEEIVEGSVPSGLDYVGEGPDGAGLIRTTCAEGTCIGIWYDDRLMALTVLDETTSEEITALVHDVIPDLLGRAGDLG